MTLRRFLFFELVSLCFMAMSAQKPYIVYPIPQSLSILPGESTLNDEIVIVAEPTIDSVTLIRAARIFNDAGIKTIFKKKPDKKKPNLLLGINGSKHVADKEASKQKIDRSVFSRPKYDRHTIAISPNANGIAQILMLGENSDAVFHGLASIEQILEQSDGALQSLIISDYADQRSRGIIEGYYGVPYNEAVTKDLFKFMARYKMNTYMYGAKSDPYHTRYWGSPYPENITPEQERIGYLSQDMMCNIAKAAKGSKVNFIWAIHPGKSFTDDDNDSVISQVMSKFQSMHTLGIRQFGIFVDDVGVPYDAATQQLCADRITRLQHIIDSIWSGDVKPLQYVPQLYAFSWTSEDKASSFFKSLSSTPSKIDIYITGAKVWSVPNNFDLSLVREWLGREPAWWWNYPCNDQDVTKLFPMDTYTNFHDEKHISNDSQLERSPLSTPTLISNPMQQGEVSKIALFSIADYAWNNTRFDNKSSWDAAIMAIAGKNQAAAMKRILPYLRYYNDEAIAGLVGEYKNSVEQGNPQPYPLKKELTELLESCNIVSQLSESDNDSDRLLFTDLSPWLNKLQTMLKIALDLIDSKEADSYPDLENDKEFRFEILTGMGDEIKLKEVTAEPSATILRPFIEWLKTEKNKK